MYIIIVKKGLNYVGNDYEEYGVGEAYALNSVKNDPILKDIVEYAVFD